MAPEHVEKVLRIVRQKLESDMVPDDLTGKVIINFQSGMPSGRIKMEAEIE